MLSRRLARHRKRSAQLAERLAIAFAEPVQQRSPGWIGQGSKDDVVITHPANMQVSACICQALVDRALGGRAGAGNFRLGVCPGARSAAPALISSARGIEGRVDRHDRVEPQQAQDAPYPGGCYGRTQFDAAFDRALVRHDEHARTRRVAEGSTRHVGYHDAGAAIARGREFCHKLAGVGDIDFVRHPYNCCLRILRGRIAVVHGR